MGSGNAGLFGGLFAGFSVWAWMWIGVAAFAVVLITFVIVRSKPRSSWVRSPEEVDRLSRKLGPEGSSDRIAS